MNSGNRVETLETQVAELEATVQGLTEELVEANERIRQIEAALGGSADATPPSDDGEVLESHGWGPGVGVDIDGDGAEGDAAEADKSGEADGGDEGENDDIIVA